ncbi:RuvC-like resolvase [Mycobacterium phage DrLupo]|uniref:RuvC-like resolvase n=1 Tax=Mycobacterium phage DrLupo TaxID=2499037 RepID=A0A3S9UQP4_9CAUD|nr:RuvC-like resolvase [Mycobacterium phage DrLupo]AZS12627.1 RuvC-like resolvase [Mycobacterium phage DrLupo]
MALVSVVAFDPGETIGWAAMTVDSINLTDVNTRDLNDAILHVDGAGWRWGQIDTRHLGSNAAGVGVHRGHSALNFVGENTAVDQMMNLVLHDYPESAVILEKFVLDPKAASGKFDLLSPVRVISAFSYGLHADAMSRGPFDDNGEDVFLRDPYNRFYLINRGDPKRTCTNERLTRWGFGSVVSHATRHAADATRIAYYFLRDCRGQSMAAREARWRAWPHIFRDPMAGLAVQSSRKSRPKARPKGERI